MLKPLLVTVLALGGCSAPGGVANALTPDEFTLGQGSSEYAWAGGHLGSDPAYSYDGENESTYAALTWSLPTWDSGLTGEDRRRIREESVILDAAAEEARASSTPGQINKKNPPPVWLIVGVIAVLAFLIYAARKKSRRRTWR
jgi:hypothetical protein